MREKRREKKKDEEFNFDSNKVKKKPNKITRFFTCNIK